MLWVWVQSQSELHETLSQVYRSQHTATLPIKKNQTYMYLTQTSCQPYSGFEVVCHLHLIWLPFRRRYLGMKSRLRPQGRQALDSRSIVWDNILSCLLLFHGSSLPSVLHTSLLLLFLFQTLSHPHSQCIRHIPASPQLSFPWPISSKMTLPGVFQFSACIE